MPWIWTVGIKSNPGEPPKLRWAALNLSALVAGGLAISWWLLHYTDIFPIVGGILGLGGVFAWLAFLSNLLSEERKKQLQQGFDSAILQKRRVFFIVLIVLLLAAFFLAPFLGTILVDGLGEGIAREIKVSEIRNSKPLIKTPIHSRHLPARGKAKIVLWTKWFKGCTYYIKISGLPGKRVVANGWKVTTVTVPDSLKQRPVVLIRPTVSILGSLKTEKFKLEVQMNKQNLGVINPYRGEAVWVGADEDVSIPEETLSRWRFDLAAARYRGEFASIWAKPRSLAPYSDLAPGETLVVNIVRVSDEGIAYSESTLISSTGKVLKFPQEIVIDASP